MFSRILLIPFVISGVYMLLQMHEAQKITGEYDFNIWLIPLVVIGFIIHLFAPQIDWWWMKRNPPKLHEGLRKLLQERHVFYRNLSLEEKERFRKRMALYMNAKEFRPMGGPETIPHDVIGFITAAAIQVTFGQSDFLMDKFEHFIIYPGAFPSPQYPTDLHNSENYIEDGVIMFSVKSIMDSTAYSPRAYHIGLHEYANVFEQVFAEQSFPPLEESIWETLASISSMDRDFVHDSVGIPEISPRPVSVHHFFVFPKKFQAALPELFEAYVQIFNLNPLEQYSPVVDMDVLDQEF